MEAPTIGEEWFALTADDLPVGAAYEWAVRPDCGAVVLFSGTVRDHADGRDDVVALWYEAYEEAVVPVFGELAAEARKRWPTLGRIVLWHRTGELGLGASSVIAVASAPHRAEAFEAARYLIDALKVAAPIWKRERWAGGEDWGTRATAIRPAGTVS